MRPLLSKIPILLLTLFVGVIASSTAYGTATIVIHNNDLPNVGFNDTTPATPVGGNSGTTVGQQRLNAFQFAADVWGATLVSGPIITIQASWAAQTCTSGSGVLGSSGNSGQIWRDISGAIPGTWYGNALANALTNTDLNGANPEINAQFNFNVGTTGCLQNSHWYYGLDNAHGVNGIDLVTVLLHEFAHGLGFQTYTSTSSGQQAGNAQGSFPSIYDRFLFDDSTNKTWNQMTDAERVASAVNTNNLVWNGMQVDSDGTFLTVGKDSSGRPLMFAPSPIQSGSSVSHWDTSASPNQLMEPNISSSLGHGVTVGSTPQDLTFSLLRDLGWCAGCPQPPAPSPTPTPSPPPNDNFANAQIISGCSGSVTGTNLAATKESGEPAHLPASPGSQKSVWYKWQAPSTGSVTIDTENSTFDTVLAVYTGSTLGGLSLVGNDDDSGAGVTSKLTFTATGGVSYDIAVDGYDNSGSRGDTGDIVLNWTQTGCTVTAPALLIEENTTNQAAAVDSVTLTRGPFSKTDIVNFSSDQRTRLLLFTSNLGLSQGENPGLSVQFGGVSVPIENVGTLQGQSQFSYIVVRLDPVGAGTWNVTVTLHGATSNIGTITIQ